MASEPDCSRESAAVAAARPARDKGPPSARPRRLREHHPAGRRRPGSRPAVSLRERLGLWIEVGPAHRSLETQRGPRHLRREPHPLSDRRQPRGQSAADRRRGERRASLSPGQLQWRAGRRGATVSRLRWRRILGGRSPTLQSGRWRPGPRSGDAGHGDSGTYRRSADDRQRRSGQRHTRPAAFDAHGPSGLAAVPLAGVLIGPLATSRHQFSPLSPCGRGE